MKKEWVPANSLQSCPTLCDPMNYSPLGSSIHGILQARILERVAIPFSKECSPDPGIKHMSPSSPAWAGGFFTTRATWQGCQCRRRKIPGQFA